MFARIGPFAPRQARGRGLPRAWTNKPNSGFDFPDRPTTFIDLESGEEVRANPAEVRENYVSKMAALRRDLDVRCGSAGIDWVDVDIAKGVNPVLTAYLLKRKKMR